MAGGWTFKRFWTAAGIEPLAGGHAVVLDGRPIRTPGKATLILPTRPLAELVAAEWEAQDGKVRPETMPATRTANTAIDTLARHRAAVVADLSAYGGTDLLCYRSPTPEGLRARQAAGWDPLLTWAASRFKATLETVEEIAPVTQDRDALSALAREVARQSDFELAAFHDLVALSGSLVIALAVIEGVLSPQEAWALSRIEAHWQAELWGEDEEASAAAREKCDAFVHAARFHALCGQASAQSLPL